MQLRHEPADAEDLRAQLREAMGHMALGRVIDVFHAWDTDDNGVISKSEFGKAMAVLGHGSHTLHASPPHSVPLSAPT
jgi:hypothetical protein